MKKGNEKQKETLKQNEKKVKHYIASQKVSKKKKEKKENVFKVIAKYFKGVFKEIKRIRWTDRKDLFKYTLCTLMFLVLLGVYFHAINWIVLLIRELAK